MVEVWVLAVIGAAIYFVLSGSFRSGSHSDEDDEPEDEKETMGIWETIKNYFSSTSGYTYAFLILVVLGVFWRRNPDLLTGQLMIIIGSVMFVGLFLFISRRYGKIDVDKQVEGIKNE